MAIHSINPDKVSNSVPQTKLANKSSVETKSQASGSITTSTDTVNITHGANIALDTDTSTSAVDEKRIADIKKTLSSGSYKIDPERVASKMMQFDQNLLTDTT